MLFILLKRNVLQTIKPFIGFLLLLFMYQGIIIYMYEPKLMETLTAYQEIMPEMMAAFGMVGATDTLIAFINTYLYGFLMLLIPFIYSLILCNTLLVKYIDTGSMALLLSGKFSRLHIVCTQAITLVCSVTDLCICITISGIVFSELFFKGQLEIKTFLVLNIGVWLLQVMISGILFCVGCFVSESKSYFLYASAVPVIGYLCMMLSNMGDTFEFLKYASIYSLFTPDKIIGGESVLGNFTMLVIGTVLLYGTGIWKFTKRDLPL
ncbi:MAG: ABC transporter permease [Lachnospiraceae bacterium]